MGPNCNRSSEIPGPYLVSTANRCGRGSSTAARPATDFRNVMQTLQEIPGFKPSSVGKAIDGFNHIHLRHTCSKVKCLHHGAMAWRPAPSIFPARSRRLLFRSTICKTTRSFRPLRNLSPLRATACHQAPNIFRARSYNL